LAQGNFEGWSHARVAAYKLRDINPNAYYYRFNEPGENQMNGKWTKEEIALFNRRMKEVGVNGQWGVFSRTIPGRVGYQCSNFYRQLIESGQIIDANYVVDEKGKAHYLFKGKGSKLKREQKLASAEAEAGDKTKPTKRKGRKRKSRKKDDDSEGEEGEGEGDDGDYRPGWSHKSRTDDEPEPEVNKGDNPLPGFTDPITLEEVDKPAISPFGHVMSYSSWSRCLSLEPRNVCPLSKKTVKKKGFGDIDLGEYPLIL